MGIKFNPFTNNFDFVNTDAADFPENFSYKKIEPLETITIPENQQMLISGHVVVQGHLSVLGSMVDISARVAKQFFYDIVVENDVVELPINMLMLFNNNLVVRGHLRVNGRLKEV